MPTKKPYPGLVPANIADIRPYVPGKPIEEVERELGLTAVKLASNENALGPSPRAMEAVMKCLASSNRYPDAGGYYLREKLAALHQVEMDQIALGAGSTELILLLGQIYLGPGRAGLTSMGTLWFSHVGAAGGR
jgi:histidinol-phosphate aminotransferase